MNDAQQPLNALPQGHRLQEYELVRVLGFGGFGMTYLGFDHNLDKAVAIKEYLPSDIATRTGDNSVAPQASQFRDDFEWGLDRFLDEARTLARFDHRHIIKVHRFFQAHGTAYIVMEYAEGETLSSFLQSRGTLSEEGLKAILYPILDGLVVVHGAEFLHRDIKPANIIIRDEDGSPVLLDFGAARQAIGARSRSVTSIITPGYAPIEQYSSRGDQGPWTDIYALGAVCYQALTGQVPDDATDRTRNDPLNPVSERCAGQARAEFLSAVDWALQVNEEDRPQSIADWRVALGEETGSSVPISPARTPPIPPQEGRDRKREDPPPDSPPKKGRGKLFAAIACIIAVLNGGGYYYQYEYLPTQRRQVQKTAEAEVAQERGQKISGLLSAASEDLSRDRLTSPAGANAWEKYQAVLALEPGHKIASAGLDSIIGRYVSKFDASLQDKDFAESEGYVSRIQSVYADAPVLSEMADRLSAARAAERQHQADEAERTRQAAAEERLRQSKITGYEGKFEEALGRKDFAMADGYVDSLRAVNADGTMLSRLSGRLSGSREAEQRRQAQEAERARLAAEEAERQRQAKIAGYERKFEEALENRDYDKADGYVDSLRTVNAEGSVLSRLAERLSAAREADPHRVGRKFKDCADCPEMVVVPLGSYTMGSPSSEEDRDDDEGPRHLVHIDYPLAVGVYEVTFSEWDACVSDGGCGGYRPSDKGWGRGNRPVINVSWEDAQSYVHWLSARTGHRYSLLSESEWEYVARAGTTTRYSWGNDIGRNRANCDGCGSRWDGDRTAPVGSFSANSWGVYDMHGNVWEWVQDCWNFSYVGAPADGSAWESGSCDWRVLRGGSWDHLPRSLHSAIRNLSKKNRRRWVPTVLQFNNEGFRIVRRF